MRLPFDSAQLVSMFGLRTIFGKKEFHYGMDFVTYNKKIYACEDGKIIVARANGGYGNNVMIQHDGIISVYGHLSKILVKEGQQVKEGDLIGIEGSTGRSTGSHLHFEFRKERYNRSDSANPANIIGFKEVKYKEYKHFETVKEPAYIKLLKANTNSPELWVGFIEEMKNHPTGKYLPQLIEKLSK